MTNTKEQLKYLKENVLQTIHFPKETQDEQVVESVANIIGDIIYNIDIFYGENGDKEIHCGVYKICGEGEKGGFQICGYACNELTYVETYCD